MLPQRVAAALVGVPIILAVIALGGALYSLATALILVLAALELLAATDPRPASTPEQRGPSLLARALLPLLRQRPIALVAAGGVALLVAGAHNGADWWAGAFALGLVLLFLPPVLAGQAETGLRDWLWAAGALAYVGFLGSHLVFLRHLDEEGQWAMVAIFATFATDTAAYFVGRALGRTRIAPAVSPGKTLQGSLGGILGGAAGVLALNWLTGLRVDAAHILPLALLLPLAAELGDLAESLIKRGAGVKDAGQLVPGHGGLLDRLDSLLFTVPLVYYFVVWVIL